ncbi:MAG: SprT family zinc-dependent metalloprotease [Pseudomonadota bacterium]
MGDAIHLTQPDIDVRLRVDARARRFTLRLAEAGAGAVLTLPPGVPEAEALNFLERHRGWLAAALARQEAAIPVQGGIRLPVDGVAHLLVVQTGPRRTPAISDGRLVVQGRGDPGPRVAAWLKERTRERIGKAAHHYARELGRDLRGIAVKDTRSRWGSCSTAGRINLSWRLAMAPPRIQDYVAAHEAAHLVEMNHSDRYWRVLSGIMPDYAERRAWLKSEGRKLHAYRFETGSAP